MKRLVGLLLTLCIAFGGICDAALPSQFALKNPDIQKYEYARSFIAALDYIKSVHERWKKSSPTKDLKGADDVMIMRGFLAYLIKDNSDLRIAKNYLNPYLTAENQLVKKSADQFILGCNTVIAINDKEKQIWEQWHAVKGSGLGTRKNETAFLNAQEELAMRRKEAFKEIIEASMLLSIILRSDKNKTEEGKLLAINDAQRKKLRKSLDELNKKNLDWGLKPGQTFQQASVAVLREVLEDPIYKSFP